MEANVVQPAPLKRLRHKATLLFIAFPFFLIYSYRLHFT